MDFVTLITTLLYNTNINAFGAPVKILQQLQKCVVENADLLRVAHIQKQNPKFCKTNKQKNRKQTIANQNLSGQKLLVVYSNKTYTAVVHVCVNLSFSAC